MNQITIIGCGLIGASFALGLKEQGFPGEIVGYDRPEVLERARKMGAVDRGAGDLNEAVAQAGFVYLATPVSVILDLLPRVAEMVRPGTLITDTGSTKARICAQAAKSVPAGVVFLGGHPMAGKMPGGIENAEAGLFRGAKYVLIGDGEKSTAETPFDFAQGRPRTQRDAEADGTVAGFIEWVKKLGAEPVWLGAETHDWAAAWVSHMPQLVSTALAAATADVAGEQDTEGLPVSLAGRGFRDMVRLGGSPYEVWRDICLTNKDNIAQALSRLEQELAHLRENISSKELAEEFEKAQNLVDRTRIQDA